MIRSTWIETGYWDPNHTWQYRVLGWGLLLKSVFKWSYVSVDNWLPLEEYIMPRRWLGGDEAFLGTMPGGRQLAPAACALGLVLSLQTGTREVVLEPKASFCLSLLRVGFPCPRETPKSVSSGFPLWLLTQNREEMLTWPSYWPNGVETASE